MDTEVIFKKIKDDMQKSVDHVISESHGLKALHGLANSPRHIQLTDTTHHRITHIVN